MLFLSPIRLFGDGLRVSGHLTSIFHSSYNFSWCSQDVSPAHAGLLMGAGEGGSKGWALLKHRLDWSFPAGTLGSLGLVLASQGPIGDLQW